MTLMPTKVEKRSEVKLLSRVRLFATPWTVAYQDPPSMGFSRQECWMDCHFLFQGIFPTQESNPGLLHCRQTLYLLSHQGSLCFRKDHSPPPPHPILDSHLGLPYVFPLVAQRLKRLPGMRETRVRFLGREDALEKEMATQPSILAWRIPRTEEPGRLQSMGSQESDTT